MRIYYVLSHQVLVFTLISILFPGCSLKTDEALSEGNQLLGRVVSVIDGDTFDILLKDKTTLRIRMEGIDAPEKGMPYYKSSKMYLSGLCIQKNVRLEITSIDRYGRTIAFSFLDDGKELSREMLKAGFAWHFKKYNSDPQLARLEDRAKEQGLGLWQDPHPMSPWRIRAKRRQGVSASDSTAIED